MLSTLDDALPGPALARPVIVQAEPIPPWRWAVFIATVATFVHDLAIARLGAPGFSDVLLAGATGVVPAPTAFRAWTLIQIALVGYGLVQLAESQRRIAVHDRLAGPIVLACLLICVQRATLGSDPALTAALSVALAATAGVAFVVVHAAVVQQTTWAVYLPSPWLPVPIALLLGWSLVTSGVAIDAAFTSAGTQSLAPAIGVIAAIGAAASTLALRHRDAVMPALVAWLLTSICAGNIAPPAVAAAALVAAAGCAASAIVIATTRATPSRRGASPSPSPRSRRA